jgi:hypothetical protein
MNFFHHVATLMGLLTGLATGRSGAELGLCLLLMEVSNPSMHMIHIFRELNMDDSAVAEINKVRRRRLRSAAPWDRCVTAASHLPLPRRFSSR